MRINNITPIKFGYSKKNQEFLEQNLAKLENQSVANVLLDCSHQCNTLEDEIRSIERKLRGKKDTVDVALTDYLVGAKYNLYRMVSSAMDVDFSDRYLEGEYKYYTSLVSKLANPSCDDWRCDIVEDITSWWPINLQNDPRDKDKNLRESKKEKEVITACDAKKTDKNVKDKDEAPLIELIKPTAHSPRGFKDISGMEELKADFLENVIEPLNNPRQAELDFLDYGKETPMGILLYGPPGCGKTFIIQALAQEVGTDVYLMNTATIGSEYINKSSVNIKKAFDLLEEKAKDKPTPIIVFLDEMDGMCSNRAKTFDNTEHIKDISTLLQCIEHAQENNVMVIGASNQYDIIDPAIRRRLKVKRFVGIPNFEQRAQMVRMNLSKKRKAQNLLADDDKINQIASALDGYSYHSINIISDKAALNALSRDRDEIRLEDFKKAIEETQEEKINETEYKPKTVRKNIGFATNSLN